MEKDQIPVGRAEDLTGQIFDKLTVLYRTKNIGKHTAWKCQCECGNLTIVRMDHLKEHRIKSCGCYNKEQASRHLKQINHKGKNMKDITGLRSGWLIALEPTEKRISYGEKNSHVVWKCQCLNPIHKVPTYCEATCTDLTTKNKTSCGCINSRGEAKIVEILLSNNIKFEQQKTFDNCRFPDTNALAKFNFWINNQYLLEYDGEQHFDPNKGWRESFEKRQQRDIYKNNWCKEHNIPLIRISYKQLNNLTITDLLLNQINEDKDKDEYSNTRND